MLGKKLKDIKMSKSKEKTSKRKRNYSCWRKEKVEAGLKLLKDSEEEKILMLNNMKN